MDIPTVGSAAAPSLDGKRFNGCIGRGAFNADVIDHIEVAHVLAVLPRFGGRTLRPYCVAQHSVYVARLVADLGGIIADQWWAINHEGDEVLLGFDPPSPMVRACPQLAALKRAAMDAYCDRFKMPREMPDIVKHADHVLFVTETRDLMAPGPMHDMEGLPDPLPPERSPAFDLWGWEFARDEFTDAWRRLAINVGFITPQEAEEMEWR